MRGDRHPFATFRPRLRHRHPCSCAFQVPASRPPFERGRGVHARLVLLSLAPPRHMSLLFVLAHTHQCCDLHPVIHSVPSLHLPALWWSHLRFYLSSHASCLCAAIFLSTKPSPSLSVSVLPLPLFRPRLPLPCLTNPHPFVESLHRGVRRCSIASYSAMLPFAHRDLHPALTRLVCPIITLAGASAGARDAPRLSARLDTN